MEKEYLECIAQLALELYRERKCRALWEQAAQYWKGAFRELKDGSSQTLPTPPACDTPPEQS